MKRLAPKQPFWRIKWAVSDNPDLFQPVAEDLIIQTSSVSPANSCCLSRQDPLHTLMCHSFRVMLGECGFLKCPKSFWRINLGSV